MTCPIGHHENTPILKFGKLYKVFEHFFYFEKGGFDAHVWVVLLLNVAYLA
jgi:hypothetical protein